KQKNRYACIECSVKCESPEELRNHRKIHQDPTWWKCNHCRNFLIRKHTKAQHPSEWKSFKCVHCKRRFPSAPMRDRHAHFHSLNHPCKCTECDQMYSSKKRLAKHFELFHNRNSHSFSMERFRCSSCPRMFVEKKYYDLHSRIYHENKPQRLKNLSEKIQDQLVEHIRQNHRGDPPLKNCICTTCHKDLKTVTLLRIHIMVVHMGISPFVCQHCSADFPSRHWLLKHMEKEHSEIALFKCPTCDDSFTTEARLIEHKDKHPYQVRYKCHCCSKMFQQKRNMLAHQNSLAHQCSRCQMRFKSKKNLSAHMAAHRTNNWHRCKFCSEAFQSLSVLVEHFRMRHPDESKMYKCPHCTRTYSSIEALLVHIQEYHWNDPPQETFSCSVCTKPFDKRRLLQYHILVAHLGQIPYACNHCGEWFRTKSHLKQH
ncbi:AAEL010259-PA, partial [Aedes aegypti]